MEKPDVVLKGYGYAFLFCLITAISSISIHYVEKAIDPTITALVAFTYCIVIFNCLNFRKIAIAYQTALLNKKLLSLVNISTAIHWLAAVWTLNYIPASIYLTLFMGLLPISTYLVHRLVLKKWGQKLGYTPLLIILLSLALIYCDFPKDHINRLDFIKGIFTMIIAVTTGSYYLICSKQFQEATQLSSLSIVSLRFYVLVIVCFFTALYQHYPVIFTVQHYFLDMLWITLTSSVIPAFLTQKSVSTLGALKFSYFIPITPMLTYCLEWMLYGKFNVEIFALISILSCVILIPAYLKIKQS